jgi:hypothetical protein
MTTVNVFQLTHDPLTKLDPDTPPNTVTVRLLCRELYANARDVPSTLGGGRHGHLGMVMPDDEYILISHDAESYEAPDKPVEPVYAGTAQQRYQQEADYKAEVKAYNEWRDLEIYLRKLMINAIPWTFIAELEHHTMGFSEVSPMAILDHLVDTYGTISPKDLQDNLKQAKTAWNPDTPIETVFTNGNRCRQFAIAGQDPISDITYIGILVDIFRDSGVLETAIREWALKKARTKTVAACIDHFKTANLYRLESQAYLKECLAATAPATAAPATAAPATASVPLQAEITLNPTMAGFHYCWSHGAGTHSGERCTRPAPGHITTATATHRQGGSEVWNLGRWSTTEIARREHQGRGGRGRGRGQGRRSGRGSDRTQDGKRKATDEGTQGRS